MQPDTRRIIAIEAHRRRSGRCPVRIHSLGTGESFDVRPTADGFLDVTSGRFFRSADGRILCGDMDAAIELCLDTDIGFHGYDHGSGEPFTGRAGGGASVTIYEHDGPNFFQYAVVAEGDRT